MRFASAAAALLVTMATASIGVGSASAAEPIVLGSCATSVQGAPGQPVSLSPSAVVQPITDLVRAVPLLGPPLAEPFRQAFTSLPPIPIGAIPAGSAHITGGTIATKVVAELHKLPLLGPIIGPLATSVQQQLASGCDVLVTGVNQAAAPVQDGTKAIADASQQAVPAPKPQQPPAGQPQQPPGATPPANGALPVGGVPATNNNFSLYSLGGNYGRVPLFSYGSLPFALPGRYSPSPGVRYGSQVPRSTAEGYNRDPVHTAGRAQALPGLRGVGGVGLPVLLAVLMLSCVTGALVRTWVLRRTPA